MPSVKKYLRGAFCVSQGYSITHVLITSGAIQKAEQDCSCRWVFQFSSSAQAGEMLITSYISIDKISQAMIFLLPIICEVNIQKQSNTVELGRQDKNVERSTKKFLSWQKFSQSKIRFDTRQLERCVVMFFGPIPKIKQGTDSLGN